MDKELTFVYCNGDDVCKGTRLLPCLKLDVSCTAKSSNQYFIMSKLFTARYYEFAELADKQNH